MSQLTFAITHADLVSAECDLVVVPVVADAAKTETSERLAALDQKLGFDVLAEAKLEGFAGKPGQSFMLRGLRAIGSKRLLLVGVGDAAAMHEGGLRTAIARAARSAAGVRAERVVVSLPDGLHEAFGATDAVVHITEGFDYGAYVFDKYLTKNEEDEDAAYDGVREVHIATPSDASFTHALSEAIKVTQAVRRARDLVNETPLVLSPAKMAESAVEIAQEYGLEHTIFEEDRLEAEGFNLIMAVGKGSTNPPRLIHLKYTPKGEVRRTIALAGKGICFDTGGYNIKVGGYMLNMHSDMGGAAAVLGTAAAIGALAPEGVAIHFLVPTADNNIDGNAMRPNDIYTGYGGKTVEIHNTDAEGRLVLADALAYAQEQEGVDTIVDLATLTGACVVALGEHTAGLFTDDDEIAGGLIGASERAGEHLWRMPLTKKLDRQLDTPVADVKNVGKRYGGAITAALFLRRFVDTEAFRWAHLDIAGPAFREANTDEAAYGGSGFAVGTLTRWLTNL